MNWLIGLAAGLFVVLAPADFGHADEDLPDGVGATETGHSYIYGTGTVGEGADMLLGMETNDSKVLLANVSDSFYGLQLTPRRGRTCHVRAFFRGTAPQTAHYCAGRVTASHLRHAGVAGLGVGQSLHGIGACLTRRGMVGAVSLHTTEGDEHIAQIFDCDTEFATVYCGDGWAIQGVQLFFDGEGTGRRHRRLMGLRPLCTLA